MMTALARGPLAYCWADLRGEVASMFSGLMQHELATTEEHWRYYAERLARFAAERKVREAKAAAETKSARRELARERNRRYHEAHRAPSVALPDAICACGCGRAWAPRPSGKPRRYYSEACGKRARRRDPEMRPKVLAAGRAEQQRRRGQR